MEPNLFNVFILELKINTKVYFRGCVGLNGSLSNMTRALPGCHDLLGNQHDPFLQSVMNGLAGDSVTVKTVRGTGKYCVCEEDKCNLYLTQPKPSGAASTVVFNVFTLCFCLLLVWIKHD